MADLIGDYTHGKILPVRLVEEMRRSYIDYAMSVIVSRALPDVKDGLKPVQRRILYSMYETGNTPDRVYKKSARIVGDVMGKYHPHGNQAIYDAMVRMAQDFSLRYPLVDGHGNFGSVDGDPPAAERYTEVRLAQIATAMVADLDKDTVNFLPNFDETEREPTLLSSRIPNLLANGSSGIAVGMATNIPPHNLGELIDGVNAMIDAPDISSEELMVHIKGPDFPTGGLIMGREGIRNAYLTGRGSITMRAQARIETTPTRTRILVTELPYEVNKARLIEKIAELVRDRRVEGISDLRDETDRQGLRVVVELKRDANPNVVLNQLFKFTPLQQNFGVIMLALVSGQPQLLTLREALFHYLEFQKEVITRRTRHDLAKAEARAHILEGLRIALTHLDLVIRLIRGSTDADAARQALMTHPELQLSEKQAQAILDLRLHRLTQLESDKIAAEHRELLETVEYFRAVLSSERMVYQIIRKELADLKERFADDRRTRITAADSDFEIEDLIAEEDMVITLTHHGYVKRLPASTYRPQRRGGRGITGMGTKEEDFLERLFVASTHHYLLFFTDRGRVYRVKVYEIPEASRTAKGTAAVNLIQIEPGEKITAVIPLKDFSSGSYLVMVTRNGTIKKTDVSEYETRLKGGLVAIGLDPDDELIDVKLTQGNSDILIISRLGQAIRFPESEVRSMGRPARGVIGMTLEPHDRVVAADVVQEGWELLVVSEKGFGKRTPLEEYRITHRGGRGVHTLRITEKNGPIAGAMVVREGSEIMLISSEGVLIRMPVEHISIVGRDTQGVTLQRVAEGDAVVSVAPVAATRDEE
jgi:DNA gyrase subunit A